MTEPHADLDRWMALLADGHRAVFDRVFELLWVPVYRFCQKLLKNDADAADAAQEALQKILFRASEYDKTRAALPWALAIAGWECRTILRKRGRRREVSDDHVPEHAGSPLEAEVVERDLVAAALSVVSELSPTDREVLLATFWDESASVSGATLRKRRERALERLRTLFRSIYDVG